MIARRKLLVAMGAGALAVPRLGWAQAAGRTYRVGWVAVADTFKEPYSLEFVRRLAELGFAEGRNLSIVRLHADNRIERMPALSAELGKVKCDAYFGGGTEASLATLTQASR